jgi:hypothetical protein
MTGNMNWSRRDLDYEPPDIDTSRPHSARLYDYLLGGKDNYPADREAAGQLLKIVPWMRTSVRQNRLFLHRVVRYLAAEQGVDQFLDLGAGIPTSPNLHEIAQEANPAARVVYVDNDPIVLAHSRALLKSAAEGRIAYVHADLREPEAVLDAPDFNATFDLDRPIALTILSTVHFILDNDDVRGLMGRYLRRLPAGSYLALTTGTPDLTAPERTDGTVSMLGARGIPVRLRTRDEVVELFDGLDLLDPGVVPLNRWHPDADSADALDDEVGMYGAVAQKP